MHKIIHHIRKQPEKIKRHILHISTVFLGIILLCIWFYTLGSNFYTSDVTNNKDLKPLSVLKNNVVDQYNNLNLH